MNKTDTEKIIAEYLKPIFGFALKRCRNIQDAEDLSQEIAAKAFRMLLIRNDISDVDKYIWTVAHNTLSSYYRSNAKTIITAPIDESAERIADPSSSAESDDSESTVSRLYSEIAYLSGIQRRIVIAYYFENRKQADIAKELGIAVGTVKWHLFEAKKELKRGVSMTREYGKLKFDPIKFKGCHNDGTIGTKGHNMNFFRSALTKNIAYLIRDSYKSVNEIADELGVSPVYVESEVTYLEKYGFLQKKGEKYISSFIINVPDEHTIKLQDEVYSRAAELIADELFDGLTESGLLRDARIRGGIYGDARDTNFMLWSLIPYLVVNSAKQLQNNTVSFEEVATMRPDGGFNICSADILVPGIAEPKYNDSMEKFFGFCRTYYEDMMFWHCDSEWSEWQVDDTYHKTVVHELSLIKRLRDGERLSDTDLTLLAERGYISVKHENGNIKTVTHCTVLGNSGINDELIAVASGVKEKHWDELSALRDRLTHDMLAKTPEHLRKARIYDMQDIFFSDPWLVVHVLKHLEENGKLKAPSEEQKKMIISLIFINK